MSKFKQKEKRTVPNPPSGSLSDIVFMLLFFFMVTTTMRETESKVVVKLPEASEIAKLERKDLTSYINIDLSQRVGAHHHLLQADALRSQQHVDLCQLILQREVFRFLLIADVAEYQGDLSRWRTLQFKVIRALRIGGAERQYLVTTHQLNDHLTHRLVAQT